MSSSTQLGLLPYITGNPKFWNPLPCHSHKELYPKPKELVLFLTLLDLHGMV